MEALEAHDRPVRLIWQRRLVLSIARSEEPTGETQEEETTP